MPDPYGDAGAEPDPPTRQQRTAQPTAAGVAAGAATHARHGLGRLSAAWRALSGEYRLAAVAAIGLFLTMFLPWYEQSTVGVAKGLPVRASDTLTAFQAFSWVEAAVLVVAFAVLVLCFTRGEQRSYHLPGGDGTVVLVGGVWVCLLVFLRQLDHPSPEQVPGLSTEVGVHWGIFVTFCFGLLLAYAGLRLRNAHRPEPGPLDEAMATGRAPVPSRAAARSRTDREATRVMLPDEEPTRPAEPPATRPTPPSARAAGPAATPAARRRPPDDGDAGEQLTLGD